MAKKTSTETAPAAEEIKTTTEAAESVNEATEAAKTEEQPAVEATETAPAEESVKAVASPVKLGINITNTRMGVKKISLPSGVLTLYPGAITRVPERDEEAARKLFKTNTFKRMVDQGAFRFTDYDTAEGLVAQATPTPPADLTSTQPIDALNKETKTVQDLKVVAVHDASAAVE